MVTENPFTGSTVGIVLCEDEGFPSLMKGIINDSRGKME